jgi:hypothetical protein
MALTSRKILSSLKVLTLIPFNGDLDMRVVAIISISDNPNVIINRLLPNPAPMATPYDPAAAA